MAGMLLKKKKKTEPGKDKSEQLYRLVLQIMGTKEGSTDLNTKQL